MNAVVKEELTSNSLNNLSKKAYPNDYRIFSKLACSKSRECNRVSQLDKSKSAWLKVEL